MCGIVGIFNVKEQNQELRNKALKMSQKIRHRGPDWSGIYCQEDNHCSRPTRNKCWQ